MRANARMNSKIREFSCPKKVVRERLLIAVDKRNSLRRPMVFGFDVPAILSVAQKLLALHKNSGESGRSCAKSNNVYFS